jgi:hypothetical protein
LTCRSWRYLLYRLLVEVHVNGNSKIKPACLKHMR